MRLKLTFPTSLTVFVICLLLATGCKKAATVEPDPDRANKVMGTYTVTTVTLGGSNQSTPVTGTVFMVRTGTSLDKVDLTLSYATAGSSGSSTFSETKTISLQQSGSAIDLSNGTTKVGSWTSTLLTITNYPFNSSTVSFTATKQ